MMARRRGLVWALAALALSACATPGAPFTPRPVGLPEAEAALVWPAPPEVPRFRFGGRLLGEANYPAPTDGGAGRRFLRWLAGIDDGSARPRTLVRPQSGLVDARGRILVTDVGRQAVFVFDVEAGLQVWERADAKAQFVSPLGIAAGPDGQFLVADAELARVIRLDGDGNPLGSLGREVLKRPTGLARDAVSGRLYVADTAAHDIKVFDDGGRLVATLGRQGTEPGQFNGPTHLAFADGRLFVSDTLNARVQVIAPDGAPIAEVARRGLYLGNVVRPKGVAVDGQGHIYVVEGYYDYLLVYDAGGRLLLPIGGTGHTAGKFFLPGGVWTDAAQRIYVADVFNGRIEIFQALAGK